MPEYLNKLALYLQLLRRSLARFGLDGFLLSLLGVIGLAYVWPEPGIKEGTWSLENLAGYGVSVIFFFYGLRLSPQKLWLGLSNWRLHVVVQLTTFLVFPLLVLPFRGFFVGTNYELIWLGAFFLAALPSTVSSSVVMVSVAGGNLPGAIFNASISSLLGVLLTPLWMSFFLAEAGNFNPAGIFLKLGIQVLFPVTLGILLHRFWGAFADTHKQKLRLFDQSIILLIVYTSFSDSFARNMFSDYNMVHLFLLGLSLLGLYFLVYGLVNFISRILGFSREDRITMLFCGSKKSLVHGTVMARVLFQGASFTGIVLLPIMLYHALQLIIASIMAQAMAQKSTENQK